MKPTIPKMTKPDRKLVRQLAKVMVRASLERNGEKNKLDVLLGQSSVIRDKQSHEL